MQNSKSIAILCNTIGTTPEIKTYDIVKEVDMEELKGEAMYIVEEEEVDVVVLGEIEAADRTIVVDTIEVVD